MILPAPSGPPQAPARFNGLAIHIAAPRATSAAPRFRRRDLLNALIEDFQIVVIREHPVAPPAGKFGDDAQFLQVRQAFSNRNDIEAAAA